MGIFKAPPPFPATPPRSKRQRKTIQVVSTIDSVGKYLVLAVCNDGTLWKLDGLYEGKPFWEEFPAPPQP